MLPEILPPGPRYVLGRALMRLVAQSAQIVGYGVGGLLLAILSPRGALAADALSFVASGLVLRFGTAARPGGAARRGSMARDSLAGLRNVFAHRPTRRILLFIWLVPACVVAPEALAAPYATHIGQPARAVGFLLMGLPIGTVAADIVAARLLTSRLQRRVIVPAALLSFVPLAAFAASPGLVLAVGLLAAGGLGHAWAAGVDGLLIDTAPPDLRNRTLALAGAGLMFTQGAGFALWGIAGQYLPVTVVVPLAAAAGVLAATVLRPLNAAFRGSGHADGCGGRRRLVTTSPTNHGLPWPRWPERPDNHPALPGGRRRRPGGRGHGEKSISPAADRDGAGDRGGVGRAAGCRRQPRRRLDVRVLEPPERGAGLER